MARIKLTRSAVDAAKPQAQAVELRDTVVPGFLCKTPRLAASSPQACTALTVEQARIMAQGWRPGHHRPEARCPGPCRREPNALVLQLYKGALNIRRREPASGPAPLRRQRRCFGAVCAGRLTRQGDGGDLQDGAAGCRSAAKGTGEYAADDRVLRKNASDEAQELTGRPGLPPSGSRAVPCVSVESRSCGVNPWRLRACALRLR